MRVENIGTSRNIPEREQRPVLAEGDVLIAEVTDVKGDRVLLKNQDTGAVLTAKLLGDIGVAVGDFVETVVDEASGGRYVLRVIDISRQAPFATGTEMAADTLAQNQAVRTHALLATLALLKNNPGADPKAAAFLSRHGLAGSAENIETLSQMAKGPSPVTALLSQIIGISTKPVSPTGLAMPATEAASQNPQSVAGQAQINGLEIAGLVQNADTQGGAVKTGQATAQTPPTSGTIQNNAAQAQALTSNAVLNETVQNNTAIRGAGQSGTGIETTAQGGVTETIVSPIGQPTEQPAGGAQAAQAVQSQNSAQTQANAAAPTETVVRVDAQGALQSTAQTEGAAADGQTQGAPQVSQALSMGADAKTIIQPFMNETAAAEQGHNADSGINDENKGFLQYNSVPENIGTSNTKEGDIAQKALRMFVLTDDVENLAGHIGKAVREMPDQLKELKLLAEDADNIVREAVSSKLDQIEKQMSLMSEVKRFDCYQIPLQTGTQQQTTAELFVYRYRGGKKAVDPDNILILLGLDTQHMGRVETLVKTSGKNLNIEFNLEDMRLGDEMETEAGLLKEAVQQAGYNFSGVSVKQLNARTTVLNAEERFDKEADGSAGNLDVRI